MSDNWLTPPNAILDRLGGWQANQTDPCAAINQPWRTAQVQYTIDDDGLAQKWEPGDAYLNPPYSNIGPWLVRLAQHGAGIALVFARTDTGAWFTSVWPHASGILFLRGRVAFYRPDGTLPLRQDGRPIEARQASALISYGETALDRLYDSGIPGQFLPLQFQRSVVADAIVGTWGKELLAFFDGRTGPVTNAELYVFFGSHPKARGRRHFKSKIRQELQIGPYRHIGTGQWERSDA
jgi:hypothetical protein